MTQQFIKPFAEFFENAPYPQLPGAVRTMLKDSLAKTREMTMQSMNAVKGSVETATKANPFFTDGAADLTSKAFQQWAENTDEAFATAQAIIEAKSPSDALKLQVAYFEAQAKKASEQAKELFELGSKMGQKFVARSNSAEV